MGGEGFTKLRNGKKIWFVSTNNTVVEVAVKGMVVRAHGGGDRADYTILLFDKDLPSAIEPMRVADPEQVSRRYPMRFPAPRPFFETEQTGHVSAQLPGFSVATWKAGDSGSPDMLPLGNELVFVTGRSTTGATPEMQQDMNTLCRNAGLDPGKYQMQWVDLTGYPAY